VETEAGAENPYWLVPFQNYKAVCPSSWEATQVADEVARYVYVGYRTFILRRARERRRNVAHGVVFERAATLAA